MNKSRRSFVQAAAAFIGGITVSNDLTGEKFVSEIPLEVLEQKPRAEKIADVWAVKNIPIKGGGSFTLLCGVQAGQYVLDLDTPILCQNSVSDDYAEINLVRDGDTLSIRAAGFDYIRMPLDGAREATLLLKNYHRRLDGGQATEQVIIQRYDLS